MCVKVNIFSFNYCNRYECDVLQLNMKNACKLFQVHTLCICLFIFLLLDKNNSLFVIDDFQFFDYLNYSSNNESSIIYSWIQVGLLTMMYLLITSL